MNTIDNIYVINMKDSTERLNKIKKEFSKINKSFTRIDAIVGKNLTKNEIKNETSKMCEYFCTPSMIGCFLSHRKAWETMIKNNDKYAIIMEDDCVFQNNFNKNLDKIITELNTDYKTWDFVYLGYVDIFDSNLSFIPQKNIHSSIKNSNLFKPKFLLAFNCYLITNECARKLLKYMNKASYHIDLAFIQQYKNLNVYASKTPIAIQNASHDSSSQITNSFPKSLNWLFNIKDNTNITYSYYLSQPLFQIMNIPITLYILIYVLMLYLIPKSALTNSYSIILLFLLLELIYGKENIKIIFVWFILLSLFYIYKI